MSRTPANKGFEKLCEKHDWTINNLTGPKATDTTRRAIHLYSTGRRHFPILEAKLAKVFKMSVAELRKKLGLPSINNKQGGEK